MTQEVSKEIGGEPIATPGLIDYLIAVGNRKSLVVALTLIFSLAGLASAYLLPKKYASITVILPPQQNSSATATASALSQIGALTGMSTAGLGGKTPDEMYVAFLKSATIQNAIVRSQGLAKHYGAVVESDARATLNEKTRAISDKKSGLITVEVVDVSSDVAAGIANSYFDELQRMLGKIATTESQLKRLFLQGQVESARVSLLKAEEEFKSERIRSGFVVSQGLAEGNVKDSLTLRSLITSREVELSVARRFATERNPDVVKLDSELAGLRAKIAEIESGVDQQKSDTKSSSKGVAAYREYKVREAAYESLVKQLEMAKIDEANDGPLVQQVDVAVPADRPVWPRKLHLAIGAGSVGLAIALVWVLFSTAVASDPRLSEKIIQLVGSWRQSKEK